MKLLVVDGHNLAYRSFFAIRELRTRDGIPTNAVFGFIRALRQMASEWQPTHQAVVLDGGLPAARMALLETYKAQRSPMPEELRPQMGLIREYLELCGITVLREEGVEADDLMASLAFRALEQGAEMVGLASNDKDMFQVVGERVCILPVAGKALPMGSDEVCAKTGVRPCQIVDWLALVGDTADNIPGARGVGPKTAARLLQQFGDLETVYSRLDELSPRLRQILEESRAIVARNRALMTLDAQLPVGVGMDELACIAVDPGRVLPFLDRMEFTRMARDLREPTLF
jgi:DNA polymerase I